MCEIVARDVRVEFPIYDLRGRSLRHALVIDRLPVSPFKFSSVGGHITRAGQNVIVTALDGISFTFSRGDRVGLLGPNGSGKTTLLRVIAGIFEPVSGELRTRGRITPLFSILDGADPDATGIECIRVRGLMLGLAERQIREIASDIAEFTELGGYLDMPIRTYSSGMQIRLAFAVATAIKPEILLMDEVIGVGDASFIERAEARLKTYIESSSIMVVATHSQDILRRWCNKAMILSKGRIVAMGDVDGTLAAYARLLHSSDLAK